MRWRKSYNDKSILGLNDKLRLNSEGNCWNNAPQESFFGHMKDEIDYKSCNEFEKLQIMVDDYMDYYNNFRCQWNLKKLTPVQFRNQLLMAA